MGTSCGCSNINLYKNEIDIDEENKINKDFFIDYNSESLENNNNNNKKSFNSFQDLGSLYTHYNIGFNNSKEINNLKSGKNNVFQSNEEKLIKKLEDNSQNFNQNFFNYESFINGKEIIYSSISEINAVKKNEIKNEEPEDEYSKYIFNYINKLRTEPKNVAKIIENNKKYIFTEENNQIYFKKNKIKFHLFKGIITFDETIDFLNNLNPMEKLIYNKNITVEIPKNEKNINVLDYLNKEVNEFNNNDKYITSFWKEIVKDPEVAFLMMVVDDNCIKTGQKRYDLANPETKCIGISSGEINNKFFCFITLSKYL